MKERERKRERERERKRERKREREKENYVLIEGRGDLGSNVLNVCDAWIKDVVECRRWSMEM